jgi:hypothetical protein
LNWKSRTGVFVSQICARVLEMTDETKKPEGKQSAKSDIPASNQTKEPGQTQEPSQTVVTPSPSSLSSLSQRRNGSRKDKSQPAPKAEPQNVGTKKAEDKAAKEKSGQAANTAGSTGQTQASLKDTKGKPKAKKSSIGRAILITFAATLVLAGSASYYWRGDILGLIGVDADSADRIESLEARLAALEESGTQTAQAQAGLQEDMVQSGDQLKVLAASVNRLEEGDGRSVSEDLVSARSMIEALEERMENFEASTGEIDPLATNEAAKGAAAVDRNPSQRAQETQDIVDLRATLEGLSTRFQSLDQTLSDSTGRIEALEEAAPEQDLQDILSTLTPRFEVETLSQRLKAIEETNPAEGARLAVIALSATELTRAAASSAPFATELEAFLILAPNHTLARELRSFAIKGVATQKTLLLEFPKTSNAIVEVERIRQGGGWWNWLVNQFTALFSIRKVGERDGEDWQAVLARAENRVGTEDINAAAQELAKLQGPAAGAAQPWIDAVAARRKVDQLTAGLSSQVFNELLDVLEER